MGSVGSDLEVTSWIGRWETELQNRVIGTEQVNSARLLGERTTSNGIVYFLIRNNLQKLRNKLLSLTVGIASVVIACQSEAVCLL